MKRITSAALLICITMSLLLSTITLAWMSDNGMSSPAAISSNLRKSYFERGTGTKDDPYIIARPRQLYYFSWLQYLGYFNEEVNGSIPTFYFKVEPAEDLDTPANTLDMSEFTLPPIGTVKNPFLGNFDGNGTTIQNLTVENKFDSLSAPPAGTSGDENNYLAAAEIIGFFGVVGEIEGGVDYNYTSETNEVKNLIIDNITVKTQTKNALIGLVAGYVNGTVDSVGVINSTVDIKSGTQPINQTDITSNITSNLSDYALVGYCTESCKSKLFTVNLDMFDPSISPLYTVVPPSTSGGVGHEWGGSIEMNNMYTMLETIRTDSYSTNYSTFVYERSDVIVDGKTVTTSYKTANKRVYYDSQFGAFVFSPSNTSGNPTYTADFKYLSGSTEVTEYRCVKVEGIDGYYITNGTNYLSVTGSYPNVSITNSTLQNNPTKWVFDTEDGTISTLVGDMMYYLTNSFGTLSLAPLGENVSNTSWTVSNEGIYADNGYLVYQGNKWTIFNVGTKISSGINYLTIRDGSIANTTESSAAIGWTFENINGSGKIYAKFGTTTYYLRSTGNGNLSVTTESESGSSWKYSSSKLSTSSYYLRYNNSWTTSNRNASTITLNTTTFNNTANSAKRDNSAGKTYSYTFSTPTKTFDHYIINRIYNKDGESVMLNSSGVEVKIDEENITKNGITYYPLTFEKDSNGKNYKTSSGNTGYVISSSLDRTPNSSGKFPDRTGDIRVSQYETSNLGLDKNDNRLPPYYISYKTLLDANYNDSAVTFKTISSTSETDLNNAGLSKYAECYDTFISSTEVNVGNKTYCYGLHFMDAQISKDNIVSVDNITILGKTYDDYQMPTSCIDFNLKEAGFINFFAGSFFGSGSSRNTTFFSLHKIERVENKEDPDYKNITAIKEIQYIYGMVKDKKIVYSKDTPYYYTYKNADPDTDVSELPEGYQIIFNTDWITNPTKYNKDLMNSNYTFYFEVPVNAGEYALGSVDNKNGAYLVYLDLAANAQVVERTRVDEKTVTTEYTSSIPNGVSLLENSTATDINPENSAFVSIGGSWSGEANFSQTGNVITDTGSGHTAVFIGSGITLKDPGGTMPVPKKNNTKTITVETSTYYDTNLVTGEKTVTVIKKTTVEENGKTSVTYTKDVTVTPSGGTATAKPQESSETKELKPDVPDPTTAPESKIGDAILNAQYVVSDTSKFALDFKFTPKGQEGATTSTYTITSTNTSENPVQLAFKILANSYTYLYNGQALESKIYAVEPTKSSGN